MKRLLALIILSSCTQRIIVCECNCLLPIKLKPTPSVFTDHNYPLFTPNNDSLSIPRIPYMPTYTNFTMMIY
jgi:hypothetical protein